MIPARPTRPRRHCAWTLAALLLLTAPPVAAEEAAPAADGTDVEQFCANIADEAADARFAWEARTLDELRMQIETRTADLEAKRLELEGWVKQRRDFLDQAEASVVAIYSRMRADAAAQQLAAMDETMAAAVLAKLDPRVASTIFNEMDPKRAVSLTKLLGGVGDSLADKSS